MRNYRRDRAPRRMVKTQEATATSCNKENSYWIWGCGWAGTGTTGCPERLRNVHPERSHSLIKQGPDWATWSKFEVSLALSRRLAKETSRGPFQSKSLYDSMKWCYCKRSAFTSASKKLNKSISYKASLQNLLVQKQLLQENRRAVTFQF